MTAGERAELFDAFAINRTRTGVPLDGDFIASIVDEVSKRLGAICGVCGCSLLRHAINCLTGRNDAHNFVELNIN